MKKKLIQSFATLAIAAFLAGCTSSNTGKCRCCCSCSVKDNIKESAFGTLPDGRAVKLYTLRNSKGMEARISSYGGLVISLTAPDRNGKYEDVTLGYDNLEGYLKETPYFGALIGRYGNRIAKGHFTLDGKTYTLAINDPPNSLHGGKVGFDKVLWNARPFQSGIGPAVELTYVSKDGEEGYPGNLKVKVVITLTENNSLRFDYTATTDKATVVNLTHHGYFNLAGGGDVLGYKVQILADKFTPVDQTLIPTGELKPVDGTPFDFRKPTAIGARIGQDDQQLKFGHGYDHNWVINKPFGELGVIARVYEPKTGRVMEVSSTEPGLQFYTGNFLDGKITGKGGRVYNHRNAFCMEPQHYPDSPNQPKFPSVVLRPGQTYKNTIIYSFTAE